MKPKVDQNICIFGAGMLLKYLLAMRDQLDGVRNARDIEAIHDMRVASRRLRAAMVLFEDYLPPRKLTTWQKQIKNTTQSLGAARDTDVQIETLKDYLNKAPSPDLKPGLRRLLLRWRQKRTKLQVAVNQSIEDLINNKTLDQLQNLLEPQAKLIENEFVITLKLFKLSYTSILSRLDQFLSFEEILHQPEKVEELHKMRIAAKWLRYSMETFSSLYPDDLKKYVQATREIQDLLGEIHDCDVWLQILPVFMEREIRRTITFYGNASQVKRISAGILYFQKARQDERDRFYQVFLNKWASYKRTNLWNKLRANLELPLEIAANISQPPSPPQSPLETV